MTIIQDRTFDEERALYGSDGIEVVRCRFDGPADGESALKECRDVRARDCFFNLRYPFWHDAELTVQHCELTPMCRAALWYSSGVRISDSKLHGIKALRECADVTVERCDVASPEFGWSVRGMAMRDTSVEGEYFMLRSERLRFDRVSLKGKYSFQYISDSVFENCEFDTKDAFWHARNVVVRDSVVRGEYLGWYCENVTFENCRIAGTQPLCYCRGLKLIGCRMEDADLAFEKSEVDARLLAPIVSVKNPAAGTIRAPGVGEVILDDPRAKGRVVIEPVIEEE